MELAKGLMMEEKEVYKRENRRVAWRVLGEWQMSGEEERPRRVE